MDQDIDSLMSRTAQRPVPGHRVRPMAALAFGIALNIAAFVVLAYWVNLLAAVFTLAATLFYVLVYTGWLKRSTPQNIVIGGAAGSIPPVVGWVAVTGTFDLPALYLFAIIFFWTPPHFWALSLLIKTDYERAGVPMLPVVAGEEKNGGQHLYVFAGAGRPDRGVCGHRRRGAGISRRGGGPWSGLYLGRLAPEATDRKAKGTQPLSLLTALPGSALRSHDG